jgi:hypothetical protein
MAVKMSILVFWVVTPCGLVGGYNPEDHHLHLHHCENLKCNLSTVLFTGTGCVLFAVTQVSKQYHLVQD